MGLGKTTMVWLKFKGNSAFKFKGNSGGIAGPCGTLRYANPQAQHNGKEENTHCREKGEKKMGGL